MIQSFPRPINSKVKKQTDDQIAKLGQLNQLVRDVNQIQLNPSSPTGIPFEWWPPAGLTNAGPKFTYTDGVELISYHIKGITPFQQDYGFVDEFHKYICTINFPYDINQTNFFPGSITGMFFAAPYNNDSESYTSSFTTPLGVGGAVLTQTNLEVVNLTKFNISLEAYNPQSLAPNIYQYAMIINGYTEEFGNVLNGLMSYDYELLLPSIVAAPTIFQD